MSDQYVGEIRMFGGNFAPAGWLFCNGQLLSIANFSVLFNLIGTTYGGDGVQTFSVPDLQGRFPVHQGQGLGLSPYVIGELTGTETVTLATGQLPAHTHAAGCSTKGASTSPVNNFWATDPGGNIAPYSTSAPNAQMNAGALANTGGGHAHENMPPFQVINFIIAFEGVFPSQN